MSNKISYIKRSGGPRSEQGKRSSSMNAIKSGAYAKLVLLPGESKDEFMELQEGLMLQLKPVGCVEDSLAAELVALLWKKMRVEGLESRIELKKLEEPFDDSEYGPLLEKNFLAVLAHHDYHVVFDASFRKDVAFYRQMVSQMMASTPGPEEFRSIHKEHPFLYGQLCKSLDPSDYQGSDPLMLPAADSAQEISLFAAFRKNLDFARQLLEAILFAYDYDRMIKYTTAEIRDAKLLKIIQEDVLGRPKNDLLAKFTQLLGKLRKEQSWRISQQFIDLQPLNAIAQDDSTQHHAKLESPTMQADLDAEIADDTFSADSLV